jgi:hypothetical protein
MSPVVWQCATVASLAAIPLTNYQTVHAMMQPIRIAAIDGRGSKYFFSAGTFEEATDYHLDTAVEACQTIFNRNPLGLDFEARVERLFNAAKRKNGSTCVDDVTKMVAATAGVFRERQIHQKFELGKIPGSDKGASEEIQCSDDLALVAVHGQIIRNGAFGGGSSTEAQYVTVFVEIIPNNDAIHNGKYAMVVSAFRIQYQQSQTVATR